MSMFSDVLDFHIAFGHPVASEPVLPDDAVRRLRRALLTEEIVEYQHGETADDIVEVADALADIAYIISGTAVAYGIGAKGNEPAGFTSFGQPHPALPSGDRAAQRTNRMAEINAGHTLYEQAEDANDLAAINHALHDLMVATMTCAYLYGIPLTSVFAEVHRSNMAKRVNGHVLRRDDGKIIKPADWQPPDIRRVLFPVEDK